MDLNDLNEKRLIRRYLLWSYKSTKEELDKIDRYFTQDIVDNFLLKQMKGCKSFKNGKDDEVYVSCVEGFEEYMGKKISKANEKKFINLKEKRVSSEYQYLKDKLIAIEKAIEHFFGKQEVDVIIGLYEQEMSERILKARDH